MNDPTGIKRRYRQFADMECKGYSDVYYGLALAVSEDDEVVGFIAGMPVVQPNLFLASVQLLTGPDGMPRTGSELRAFLKRRGGEVGDVMRSRRTQTNEVGRCAVLLPALPSGPLALVEVGASAGLCLLLDRYYYDYGSTRIGTASSPVRLRCTAVGPVPLPAATPQIVWRRGLDVSPIDVHDDDAVGPVHARVSAALRGPGDSERTRAAPRLRQGACKRWGAWGVPRGPHLKRKRRIMVAAAAPVDVLTGRAGSGGLR